MKVKLNRRNIFIKKRFQTDFAIRFLILIVLESLLGIGLFSYMSRGTIIAGYSGTELVVAKTGEYFLPTLLLVNLSIIVITAAMGFVVLLFTSHKIAGPLYRFEKSLERIKGGDLTHRFGLRTKDQLGDLADRINEFTSEMDGKLSDIQKDAEILVQLLTSMESDTDSSSSDKEKINNLLEEALERVKRLNKVADFFKTSHSSTN